MSVTLINNGAYTLGTPKRATVFIVSDEQPTVSIEASDAVATEVGPTTATFIVSRNGSTSAPLTVAYTVSGTATVADDYIALKKRVTIPIGASEVSIVVTPIDDTQVEAGETVVLTLKASAAYLIDAASSATLTIVSDDAAGSGVRRWRANAGRLY